MKVSSMIMIALSVHLSMHCILTMCSPKKAQSRHLVKLEDRVQKLETVLDYRY